MQSGSVFSYIAVNFYPEVRILNFYWKFLKKSDSMRTQTQDHLVLKIHRYGSASCEVFRILNHLFVFTQRGNIIFVLLTLFSIGIKNEGSTVVHRNHGKLFALILRGMKRCRILFFGIKETSNCAETNQFQQDRPLHALPIQSFSI